jgi:hypothetical protein
MRKIIYEQNLKNLNKNEKFLFRNSIKKKKPLKISLLNLNSNSNIQDIKYNTSRLNDTHKENISEEFPLIHTITNKLNKTKRIIKPLTLTNTPSISDIFIKKENYNNNHHISKSNRENFNITYRFRNIHLNNNLKTYLVTSLNRPKLLQTTLRTDSELALYNNNNEELYIKNKKSFKLSPLKKEKINLKKKNFYFQNFQRINTKRRISYVQPLSRKFLRKSTSFTSFEKMIEELDSVPEKKQQINYINKLIKKSLRNDINSSPWEEEDYIFYNKFENRINFFFDRILLPQLNNHLYFKNKNYDNFNELNEALIKSNFISKEIQMSLNRQRVKLLLKNDELYKKIQKERILKGYEKNRNDMNLTEKFELEDFFIKKYNYNNIKFANKKEKKSLLLKCKRYSMTILSMGGIGKNLIKIKELNNIE